MLKKDITFENFEGVQETETHYFHIYEAELVEFLILHGLDDDIENGLKKMLDDLIKRDDRAAILEMYKEFIMMGYGERNPEKPEKFLKTPEIANDFKSSPAFKALYLELMTSPNAATEFLMGAVPKSTSSNPKVVAEIAAIKSGESKVEDVDLPDDTVAWPTDNGPQPSDSASGLKHPRDIHGRIVPWAFREPAKHELMNMTNVQKMDVYERKSSDWQPFAFKN